MKQKNIHRTEKVGTFTVVDNSLIKDRRLSLAAKGLASVLLERPDDWKIYARDIVKRSSDGRSVLDNCLSELEEFGYLSRQRMRDNRGRFKGYRVQFYESPELNPNFNQSLTTNGITGYGDPETGETIYGITTTGNWAPTKDLLGLSPEKKQKRKRVNTDGTDGIARNGEKTAAAAEILKILNLISLEMAKPLQAPKSLIKNLQAKGETAQSTRKAWEICKANAYKPSGAFIHWLKSGYLPPQPSNFKAKDLRPTPPSSAPPPPPTVADKLADKLKKQAWRRNGPST